MIESVECGAVGKDAAGTIYTWTSKIYSIVSLSITRWDIRIEMSSGGNVANVDFVSLNYMYPGTNEYLLEVFSEGKPEGENFFVCVYPQLADIYA
jgi:hypothetical protein